MTRFQTWPLRQKLCYHYLRLERKQKNSWNKFNTFRVLILLFLSFFLTHLEFKRWMGSYTALLPSETITDSRPNLGTSDHKRHKNPTRWGGTYLYSWNKELTPGHGGRNVATTNFSFSFLAWVRSPSNQLQGISPTFVIFSQLLE